MTIQYTAIQIDRFDIARNNEPKIGFLNSLIKL